MLKSIHKMSLRSRLVILTVVSMIALLIALLSAWRTTRMSETFADRQAESSVSNAVREMLREERDNPNGRSDLMRDPGKKLLPHERDIYSRYADPFSRSAAIALHRFPETAGGFCAADGQIQGLIVADNFGANLSAEERADAENLCRQMSSAQDFTLRRVNLSGNKLIVAAAHDFPERGSNQLADNSISGAFVFQRLPQSSGLSDWFSLATQGFLLISAVGLAAFSFLTWRDWQSGMKHIETGLSNISGDLQARIALPPMMELKQISRSINELAANLDKNIRFQKELEQTIIKNEKLTSLGRVVAGVAHEVRNPLASMKLKIQLAGRGDFEKTKIEKTFQVLREEIDRLDNLVKKLLDVSRPAKLDYSEFSLAGLIEQRLNLLAENAAAQKVEIKFNKSSENNSITADRDRLAQVLDNLFRNALEAMPNGGQLGVELERAADFYQIKISDSGPGFSETERERLFEPFFTTKDKGTGLGLTVSREIVQAHDGKIYLLPAAKGGASFVIELPDQEKI